MSLIIPHNKNSISVLQHDQGNISNMEIRKKLFSGDAMVISLGDLVTSSINRSGPNVGLKIVYQRSTDDIALLDSNGQIFILNLGNNNYRKVYKSDNNISALSFANSHADSLLISFANCDILRLNYYLANNESSVLVKSKFMITSMISHPSESTSIMCSSRLSNNHSKDLVTLLDNRSLQCLSILGGHREVVSMNFEFDGLVVVVLFKEDGAYFYHTSDQLLHWCHCGSEGSHRQKPPSTAPMSSNSASESLNNDNFNQWSSCALTHDNSACILAADSFAKLMVYSLPQLNGSDRQRGKQREIECSLLAIIDLNSHYISADSHLSVLLALPKSSHSDSSAPPASSTKKSTGKSIAVYDFIGLLNTDKLIFLRLLFERKSVTESPTASPQSLYTHQNNPKGVPPVHYIVALTYEPFDVSSLDPSPLRNHQRQVDKGGRGRDTSSSRGDNCHDRILVTREGVVVVITPGGQLVTLHPLSVLLSPHTTSSSGHSITPIQLSVQLCRSTTKTRSSSRHAIHPEADKNINNCSRNEETSLSHSHHKTSLHASVRGTEREGSTSVPTVGQQDPRVLLQWGRADRGDGEPAASASSDDNGNVDHRIYYSEKQLRYPDYTAITDITSPSSSSSSSPSSSGNFSSGAPTKNTKQGNSEPQQHQYHHHHKQQQQQHLGRKARAKSQWQQRRRGYFTEEPLTSHRDSYRRKPRQKEGLDEQSRNQNDNLEEGLPVASFRFGVTVRKLKKYFAKYAVYPTPYRGLVWRLLLELPENTLAFSELGLRGMHPRFEHLFSELYVNTSNRKVIKRLRRLCSCVAHWCPVTAELSYLPKLILPLLSVYPTASQDIFVFESTVTVLLHWARGWLATHPHPPAHLLDMASLLLETLDPPLHRHLEAVGVEAGSVVWGLMTSLLAEILPPSVWQSTMDWLLTNSRSPELLLLAAIAVLRILRVSLLNASKAAHVLGFLREQQGIDYDTLSRTITAIRRLDDKVIASDTSDSHSGSITNAVRLLTVKNLLDIVGGKSLPPLMKSQLSAGAQRMISLYESMIDYAGSSVFPLPKGGYPAYSGYPEVLTHMQSKEEYRSSQLRESIEAKLRSERQMDSLIASVLQSNYTQKLETVKDDLKQREVLMIDRDKDFLRELLNLEQQASLKKQARLEDIQRLLVEEGQRSGRDANPRLSYEVDYLTKVSERDELLEAIRSEKERSINIETEIMETLQYLTTNRPRPHSGDGAGGPPPVDEKSGRSVKEGAEEAPSPKPPSIQGSTEGGLFINSSSDKNGLQFTAGKASRPLTSMAANRYQSSKLDSSRSSNASRDTILSNSSSSNNNSKAASRSTSSPTSTSTTISSSSPSSSCSKASSVSAASGSDSITVSSSSSHRYSPPVPCLTNNIVSKEPNVKELSKDANTLLDIADHYTSVNVNQRIPSNDKTHSHAPPSSLPPRVTSADYSDEAQRRRERVARLLWENDRYYTPSNGTSTLSGGASGSGSGSSRRVFSDSDNTAPIVGEVKGEQISPPTPSDQSDSIRDNNDNNMHYLVNKSGSFSGSDVAGVRSASTPSTGTTSGSGGTHSSSGGSNSVSVSSHDEDRWDAFRQISLRRPLPISLSPYRPPTSLPPKTEAKRDDTGDNRDTNANLGVPVTFGLPSKTASAFREEADVEVGSRGFSTTSREATTFAPQRNTWEIKSNYDRTTIPKDFEFSSYVLEQEGSGTRSSLRRTGEGLLSHLYESGDATLLQRQTTSAASDRPSFSCLDALSESEEYQYGSVRREKDTYSESEAIRRNKRRLHIGP